MLSSELPYFTLEKAEISSDNFFSTSLNVDINSLRIVRLVFSKTKSL